MEHFFGNIFLYLIIMVCLSLTFFNLMGNVWLMITALVFAFVDGFTRFNEEFLLYLFLVFALGELWEFVISFFGIKRKNVSWAMVFVIGCGTVIGVLLGTALLPLIGSVLGGAIGAAVTAYTVEYLRNKNHTNASNLAFAAFKTQLLAVLGKITAGVVMASMLVIQSLK